MRNFLRIAISFLLVIIFHAKAAAELIIGGDDANSVVLELFARKYEQQKKPIFL